MTRRNKLGLVFLVATLGLMLLGADTKDTKTPQTQAPVVTTALPPAQVDATKKADAPATPAPASVSISAEDQLALKNTELKALRAQDTLKSSPAYTQFQQAMNAQQEAIQALVKKYHINPSQYTLCDGQGAPPCSETKPDTMEFRTLVQAEESKGNELPKNVVPPPAAPPAKKK